MITEFNQKVKSRCYHYPQAGKQKDEMHRGSSTVNEEKEELLDFSLISVLLHQNFRAGSWKKQFWMHRGVPVVS